MKLMVSILLFTFIGFSSIVQATPNITCANKNANYDVTQTISNNVPLYQCYLTSRNECSYNIVAPTAAYPAPGIGTCPNPPAGADCCGWRQPALAQKLCCNLNTGLTVPASPRGCTNGQALTQVASGAECVKLCIKNGGPGGNGNTNNCGH